MRLRAIPTLLLAASGFAQAPAFEAASIKPSGPRSVRGWEGGPGSKDPTRYKFGVATLMDFIVTANDVHGYQVSSKLPLDKDSFDLEAKLPEGATKAQFEEMMRNLLTERFHMKVHMEMRDFPAYEMTVGKAGLKLTVAEGAEFPPMPSNRPGFRTSFSSVASYQLVRMRMQQEPMLILAQNLEIPAGKPVVDHTGLDGKYDFTLAFTTEPPSASDSGAAGPAPAPDIFKAIQQIGLQLTPKKLPFKVVVVDAVDKMPADN